MAFRQALEEEKDLRNQVWDSSGWGRPGMGCFSGKHRIFWGREVALGLRITDQAASLTSHGGHRSARWKDGESPQAPSVGNRGPRVAVTKYPPCTHQGWLVQDTQHNLGSQVWGSPQRAAPRLSLGILFLFFFFCNFSFHDQMRKLSHRGV